MFCRLILLSLGHTDRARAGPTAATAASVGSIVGDAAFMGTGWGVAGRGGLRGNEGTWLCFCFFTIAGRPKKESPYGHFGWGGDDLGELGAARPAERPKFRPDFGLGDPAMCDFPACKMNKTPDPACKTPDRLY